MRATRKYATCGFDPHHCGAGKSERIQAELDRLYPNAKSKCVNRPVPALPFLALIFNEPRHQIIHIIGSARRSRTGYRSTLPFDRTSHRGHLLLRAEASFGHLLDRLEQVAASICHRLYARGIEPSAILQLVLSIESKEVGRALRVIGSRRLLRLIDNVGKCKTMLAANAFILSKESSLYASVSFGMMAIVPIPISRNALASATIRPMLAFTYGQ
jgi:hypothetical protein